MASSGDSFDTEIGDEAKNVTVGKGNRQTVTEVSGEGRAAIGSHQSVTNVDVHDKHARGFNSEMELLHIRQQVDRTGDRIEDVARRVQQIEIVLQINMPGRSSQSERMFMILVIVASLSMFLINAYIQVVAR